MSLPDEVLYRQRLAEGFLTEARQDFSLKRWRACVDNSQLATENAAKGALALLGPVGRTHNPAGLLRTALEKGEYPVKVREHTDFWWSALNFWAMISMCKAIMVMRLAADPLGVV